MSTKSSPSIVLVQTHGDVITIVAEFPTTSPEELFDYWTKPELLKKWWPPAAEVKPESGGNYHFSWPSQNWHLRGTIQQFSRGKELAFTWKWDHEKTDRTQVKLKFERMSEYGTRLTLNHGWYAKDGNGKKLRDEHVEGWMHFLGRLQEQTSQAKS